MSSIKLDHLIKQFPEEREVFGRLQKFLDERSGECGKIVEITVQRMYDLLKPSSQRVLALLMITLVKEGIFRKLLRVESDAMGGIGDFRTVSEIPAVLFDPSIGHNIEVRLDQVKLIYRLNNAALCA